MTSLLAFETDYRLEKTIFGTNSSKIVAKDKKGVDALSATP